MCRRTLSHPLPGSNNPYLERDNMSQDSVMGIDPVPRPSRPRPPGSTLRVSETSFNWPRTSMSASLSWRPPVLERPSGECGLHQIPTAVMNPRQIRDFARPPVWPRPMPSTPTPSPASLSPSDTRPLPDPQAAHVKADHRHENCRVPSPQARPRPSSPKPPQTHPERRRRVERRGGPPSSALSRTPPSRQIAVGVAPLNRDSAS